MNIRKIVLNNIRSYKQQKIDFSEGSTLLSGDIGSGKTSILLAIEFALFGLQPGQRGSSLLRNGENEGGVLIEFEVDGKQITIERTLKRGKTVSQDYCAITIDGEKEEVAVTELKNRVLSLLDYPREFAKKQNMLYKFTVYTPQEEMKQIILEDPQTRINTLRHVFGIDKYKKILENVSIITAKIREERRLKEGITANLEQDKLTVVSKENDLETKHYNLSSVEKELFLKTEDRKKIQEEKDEISKQIEEKRSFQQEIEKTKIMTSHKKEVLSNNSKRIEEIKDQIVQLEESTFDENKIKELEEQILLRKEEKRKLNEENLETTSQITSLDIKNADNEKIKIKITNVEICPTCLQDVSPVYKTNVVNKLESDISKNNSTIKDLKLEKQRISERILKIDSEIYSNEKELQESNLLKIKFEGIKEKRERIRELENTNSSVEKDLGLLIQHIESLEESIFELKKFDNVFTLKQSELEEALRQEKLAEIKVAELKKEIDVFSKQIEELKESIKKTEEIRKQLEYLIGLEDWLSKKFAPLIAVIEKNVMVKLKTEFSTLFAEWFGMLVPDTFNIQLTDDFTPVIEYQDYEISYTYLSGGERTAIALAYRLALNQVINSLLSKIKTKDLVILDEPTDGFSEQQLDKMRDVLLQLDVKQMIIVSHEQKIEGFVENVVKLRKAEGVSRKET
jgi:exonuclease SbcC